MTATNLGSSSMQRAVRRPYHDLGGDNTQEMHAAGNPATHWGAKRDTAAVRRRVHCPEGPRYQCRASIRSFCLRSRSTRRVRVTWHSSEQNA